MPIKEFGFDSGDESIGSKGNRLKLKEGESYRLSFVWFKGLEDSKPLLDEPTPKFIACNRFYVPGVGYFVDNGPEFARLAGVPSKTIIGTVVCQWPTDRNGMLDKTRFAAGEFSMKAWTISQDKYKNIKQISSEFPLGKHDITVACTDTQFQKITVSPCKESLFRKLYENGKASLILASAIEVVSELPRDLAQDLTLDQVREKMGKGGTGPMGGGSGSRASNTSPEFDNMLDDILTK